ncbi:MAG: glycosyltransferase, partial [Clostridia bacterium]|nr:glycosyltransferase [Clostridia bacterium]
CNIKDVRGAWQQFFEEHPEYKILHSHVRSYASIYLPIAKKYGLKTIIHSHSTSNGTGITSIAKKLLQYPLRFQADYFFGCSEESGRWLFGEKVVKSSRYYILKNAVDTELYQFHPNKRREYRDNLHLEGKRVFIHVGRLHPAKNHMFLLEVFAELQKNNHDDVLRIVGDGDLREAIQSKIQELQLADNVIMLGNRSDVPELLQAADGFLFPSIWEGLPLSVIEAQAAGLPCFVSDTVTDEVCVSDLVYKLPIDQGVGCWVQKIQKSDFIKKSVTTNLIEAGFDVINTAEQITKFYIAILQ